MPRDLFGNVTRPSISLGNRKWYTVPLSLLSHSIVVAMVIVVPLMATDIPRPVYPQMALAARVLRSVPLLDQAALEAVRQWEYLPTTLNGVPVPVIMSVTVTFKLSDR